MSKPRSWMTPEIGAFVIGVAMIVAEEVLRITQQIEPSPTMIAPAVTLILGAPIATAWKGRRNGNGKPSGPPSG